MNDVVINVVLRRARHNADKHPCFVMFVFHSFPRQEHVFRPLFPLALIEQGVAQVHTVVYVVTQC